jgi:hypothetical protein
MVVQIPSRENKYLSVQKSNSNIVGLNVSFWPGIIVLHVGHFFYIKIIILYFNTYDTK